MMEIIIRIRLLLLYSLIFSFLTGCIDHYDAGEDVLLGWEGHQATSLSIERRLLAGIPDDQIKTNIEVRLAKPGAPAILGEVIVTPDRVVFRPVIPFTPGMQYELYLRDKKYSDIDIATPGTIEAPVVVEIFPGQDTLPENLLKVYVQFSQPMQEGSSAEHIVLVKEKTDTLKNVFLDLQPELWNHNRTILTLWLDPGRIKRDLQPNKSMGPPLIINTHYSLVVKSGWQDANGVAMKKSFCKNFVTIFRDSISPDPDQWIIKAPRVGSRDSLTMDLHESLDYQLLFSSLRMVDSKGNELPGTIQVKADESIWMFQPFNDWRADTYTIEIASKLEDLAGNNLSRLFDTDLTQKQNEKQEAVYKKSFMVR